MRRLAVPVAAAAYLGGLLAINEFVVPLGNEADPLSVALTWAAVPFGLACLWAASRVGGGLS